jgi:T-complex protein 1 subunit beta
MFGDSMPTVLEEGAQRETGENSRMASFMGAFAICDLVKTTLGPKGMDKILQPMGGGQVQITNDGATILKSIMIDNPAAKVLVEISKVQDDEVGDGTTSVCVLAGELLKVAEDLISQKIHPQTIIAGFRQACDVAAAALEKDGVLDNSADPEAFREDLLNIARTTLSSKVVLHDKDHFANLCVDAVMRLKGSTNIDMVQIIKKEGGTMIDSYLEEGFILEKSFGVGQPKRIENAKILVANTPMDTDKIKIYGAKVKVDSMEKTAAIEEAEKEKMRVKCQKIIDHDINVFINRQLIYNFPEQIFTAAGISSIEHADFDGIERLGAVLGAEIASTFDTPEATTLGECECVEEILIGEDKMIRFSGVKSGTACTIVLRGAGKHVLEETERSIHDALCVISQCVANHGTVFGGGCSEVLMATAVDKAALTVTGKQALAMQGFAKALRAMPGIIADNAGYDSIDLVQQISAAHAVGKKRTGLDMNKATIGDMEELGVVESLQLKRNVLRSAAEAAEQILRVDDIIHCAPRQREGQGGMPPGMGGMMG